MKESKRNRSRSRSKHKLDGRHHDSEHSHSPSPPKRPRTTDQDQVSLSAIMETLQEVKTDLRSMNARVSSMENYWQQSTPAFPPKTLADSDALSVLAFSDVDLVSEEEGLNTASPPPSRANEPSTRANEPPTGVFEPQTKADKPSNGAGNQTTEANEPPNGGDLYDPDSQRPSWEPKEAFAAFLQKNFRQKLSDNQVIFLKTIPFRPWTVCFLQPWTHPSLIRFSHLGLESILKSETRS